MALTEAQWTVIINAITALSASLPGIIAALQNSTVANKEELIARIKAAQASWPEWT
jgi:hypothetical protein